MSNELTGKQQAFVNAYLIYPNVTQAYLTAGYKVSAKVAEAAGCRLLVNVKVAAVLDKVREERLERTGIDADYVLNRHVAIDQLDILDILKPEGGIKDIEDWPTAWRGSLSSYDVVMLSISEFANSLVDLRIGR